MNWLVKDQVPSLRARDLRVGWEFYRRLGFERKWQWPRECPVILGLGLGGFTLMLSESAVVVPGAVYYVVDDVEACFRDVVDQRPWEVAGQIWEAVFGGESVPERALAAPDAPSVKEHRHFDFTVVDPWGNEITFGCEAVS